MFVVIRIANGDLGVACARDVSLPWRTFLTSYRGSEKMTQFALAARAQIRNIVLCTLATLTLAACGGGEDGSSSAAAASTASDATASDSTASPVSPNVGMIDRSQGVDATATTAAVANTGAASTGATAVTVASSTSSSSGTSSSGTVSSAAAPKTTTPASGTTSGTGTTTTVASSNKSTTPVKATTTNGVATLDWLPPTENSDGSALTNLAGYTVYYGTSSESLTQSIKVTNPGLTAYTVTNLSTGTWYFAVTSYSSTGVESTRTGTVSTTI
jgi:hypothetical protein